MVSGLLFASMLFLRYNSPKQIGGTHHESLNLYRTRKIRPSGQAEAGDSGSPGCGCAGDSGLHLHQRSAHQARLSAPGGARHHGGT